MDFLKGKQASGIQLAPFEIQRGVKDAAANIPDRPGDFDQWPGKYALDCDAPELGAWVIAPGYDSAASGELDAQRGERMAAIKDAGFARVHAHFPPHRQRRLAFKAAADAERITCRDMIDAVKARVDTAKAAILAMTDTALMDTERNAALNDIAAM